MAVIAPHIANGIVIMVTYGQLKNINLKSDEKVKKGDFKLLDILHHFSAGVKAVACEM